MLRLLLFEDIFPQEHRQHKRFQIPQVYGLKTVRLSQSAPHSWWCLQYFINAISDLVALFQQAGTVLSKKWPLWQSSLALQRLAPNICNICLKIVLIHCSLSAVDLRHIM